MDENPKAGNERRGVVSKEIKIRVIHSSSLEGKETVVIHFWLKIQKHHEGTERRALRRNERVYASTLTTLLKLLFTYSLGPCWAQRLRMGLPTA
jgi:hypothetical protein